MKKKLTIGLIVFLVIVAGAAVFLIKTGRQSDDVDNVTLRLKWLHQSQFAGYYAAEQEGFYKEEGINVRVVPGGAETPSIQIVAGVNP